MTRRESAKGCRLAKYAALHRLLTIACADEWYRKLYATHADPSCPSDNTHSNYLEIKTAVTTGVSAV